MLPGQKCVQNVDMPVSVWKRCTLKKYLSWPVPATSWFLADFMRFAVLLVDTNPLISYWYLHTACWPHYRTWNADHRPFVGCYQRKLFYSRTSNIKPQNRRICYLTRRYLNKLYRRVWTNVNLKICIFPENAVNFDCTPATYSTKKICGLYFLLHAGGQQCCISEKINHKGIF